MKPIYEVYASADRNAIIVHKEIKRRGKANEGYTWYVETLGM